MKVLRKLKVELQYDPAIPLLGIYPDETIIQKDTCTPVFTAAVFTTAKTWEQPAKEYYLVIKKNKIMPFTAIWMQSEIIMLSKACQKDKDKTI